VRRRESDEQDLLARRLTEVDAVDRKILGLLAAEARLSARAIARELGMSPGAISERIDRLERTGAIRGYHADIEPAGLGFGLQMMVGLQIQQGPPLTTIVSELLAIPEIQTVRVVTGQWDLVVELFARDHRHLQYLVAERLWSIPGFRHSESMLILSTERAREAWAGAEDEPPTAKPETSPVAARQRGKRT
jgi:DNA-binding Lrp family transcriptional regulator